MSPSTTEHPHTFQCPRDATYFDCPLVRNLNLTITALNQMRDYYTKEVHYLRQEIRDLHEQLEKP